MNTLSPLEKDTIDQETMTLIVNSLKLHSIEPTRAMLMVCFDCFIAGVKFIEKHDK